AEISEQFLHRHRSRLPCARIEYDDILAPVRASYLLQRHARRARAARDTECNTTGLLHLFRREALRHRLEVAQLRGRAALTGQNSSELLRDCVDCGRVLVGRLQSELPKFGDHRSIDERTQLLWRIRQRAGHDTEPLFAVFLERAQALTKLHRALSVHCCRLRNRLLPFGRGLRAKRLSRQRAESILSIEPLAQLLIHQALAFNLSRLSSPLLECARDVRRNRLSNEAEDASH